MDKKGYNISWASWSPEQTKYQIHLSKVRSVITQFLRIFIEGKIETGSENPNNLHTSLQYQIDNNKFTLLNIFLEYMQAVHLTKPCS